MLAALDFALGPSHEIVIVGNTKAKGAQEMLRALRRTFIPNKVVLFRPSGEKSPKIARLAKFTRGLHSLEGKATAYVCQNHQCQLPTTDAQKMLELLKPTSR
ncbi:MAG: hypothetical protein A2Z21_05790 [Candidatus Fraserbacteria bacterium RBG_16_55_9]|uniref:Thioredoxin domain-containing protein n=1 Tax=Fraserbacteria sp. (strain RBG_16_55_9) TaxID=1817864 RepID=A0A1F5UPR3_FRAXR|nr:MAG: hypothetical protein A2Z21_05790 [Candidatus Fraserbacteria bacterium RBG_16_55_9]